MLSCSIAAANLRLDDTTIHFLQVQYGFAVANTMSLAQAALDYPVTIRRVYIDGL
jgi:hypothetical protein